MVAGVDELVVPRVGIDYSLHVRRCPPRSRDSLRARLRENLVESPAHPFGRHRRAAVGASDDHRNFGNDVCSLAQLLHPLLVESGVGCNEIRRNLDYVRKLRRTIERRRKDAVESPERIAARIEDDSALDAKASRHRLCSVEYARPRADNRREVWRGRKACLAAKREKPR